MSKLKYIIAGAGGGIVCGIVCLAFVLSGVTASREGPGAGIVVLVVSPLYFFLYIVAFFYTLLPAGLITGTMAGLSEAILPRPWSIILSLISGMISGGVFGVRFTDIFLESRDTKMDLIVGGIEAGVFLAISGALLVKMLHRYFRKSDR